MRERKGVSRNPVWILVSGEDRTSVPNRLCLVKREEGFEVIDWESAAALHLWKKKGSASFHHG